MILNEYAEATMPWIIFSYGRTHDKWWPFWSSTRVLGYALIGLECCVCGKREIAKMQIPRFGPVPQPAGGRHSMRQKFCDDHAHPDRGHPISWARPLKNMAVFDKGLPVDLLAMRLEADLNDSTEKGDA